MATVDDLKRKLAEAMTLHDKLRARADLARRAGLSASYDATVGRFAAIVDKVRAVTGAGSMTDAVRALWGGSVAGLGFLPVLPLLTAGAIAATVAVIGNWLVDAYELDRRLDAAAAQIAAGVTPSQAARNVATAAGDGPQGKASGWKLDVSGLALPALIVGGLFFGPRLVEAIGNKRSK